MNFSSQNGSANHCGVRVDQSETIEAVRAAALEASAMGTYKWNMQTGHIDWDRGHEALWGYEEGEFDGTFECFSKKVHPDDLAEIQKKIAHCLENRQSWHKEFRIFRDGETRWIVNSGDFEYDADGEPICMRGVVMESTRRKEMEIELKESRNHLSSIIDSVDGVVFEFDLVTMKFTFVSPQAEELLGFPWDEWLKDEFFWRDRLHLEDLDEAIDFRASMVAKGTNHRSTYRMIAADGSIVWIDEMVSVVLVDGEPVQLRGIMTDVSKKVAAEEKASRSNRRFRALIENNPSCIQLIDRDMRTIYVSPAVESVLGVAENDLVGSTVFENCEPEDRDSLQDRLRKLSELPDEQSNLQWRWQNPSGEIVTCEGIATNLLNDPAVEAIVLNYRDITEKVRLEEDLRQAQKMEAVGRLAGGVAHDFNNLLTIINGYSSLISTEKGISQDVASASQEILEATERATSLTRQLLAFGRKQVMQPKKLCINQRLKETLSMLKRIVGEDIEMELDVDASELHVFADSVMIDQMILNLVVNSRDAMEIGRGKIQISTGRVTTGENAGHIFVDVSDNGSGIPQESLDLIFDPFFTTKEQGRGTGLGLATVFGIVEQHQGKIEMQSEEGVGTSFRILLPEILQETTCPDGTKNSNTSVECNETILLAEDESSVRNLIRIILSKEGYDVIEAENGVKAIEIWNQERDRIDLLLTDVIMPGGLTGFELASHLREEEPDFRVAFMSGYSADVAGRELNLEDGQNFIQKPASREKLLATVRDSLGKSSRHIGLAN